MLDIKIIDDVQGIDLARWSELILESYWGQERTEEKNRLAFLNSVCVAAVVEGRQVGFARAVSDRAVFAYMADVVVEPEARGTGIGQTLINALLQHPQLRGVDRWSLRTADAHSLYERFGFVTTNDGFYMLRAKD